MHNTVLLVYYNLFAERVANTKAGVLRRRLITAAWIAHLSTTGHWGDEFFIYFLFIPNFPQVLHPTSNRSRVNKEGLHHDKTLTRAITHPH